MSTYREEVQEPELVYAKVANIEIPQMVIKFYESKLTWHEHLGESIDTKVIASHEYVLHMSVSLKRLIAQEQ